MATERALKGVKIIQNTGQGGARGGVGSGKKKCRESKLLSKRELI